MNVYTVVLKREAVGGYSVSVPALPGCHTQGDSLAEALLMAEDATRLFLEALAARGQPAPPDNPQVVVDLEDATEALIYCPPAREGAGIG